MQNQLQKAEPELIGPNEEREILQKAADGAAVLTADAIAAEQIAEAEETIRMVGRMEALDWVATVASSQIARIFLYLKESKSYRNVQVRDADKKWRRVATLEEFCELKMPVSYRRCREIAANYRALGQQLFETTEQLGFREQDYRAIRALPEDDREAAALAIQQAAESGDRDAALSVLAELVARHKEARESAEDAARVAQGQRDEALADYEAASKLLGSARTEIEKLKGGQLQPAALDQQMAGWPGAAGYLINEMRKTLVQLNLLIESAEDLDIPEEGTPASDVHSRAMRLVYDAISRPLNDFDLEVQGTLVMLDRVIGACAYPNENAPLQGEVIQ